VPQLGDHQLEMRDHRLGADGTGLGRDARLALGRQYRAQGLDIIRVSRGGRHTGSESETVASCHHYRPSRAQPAASGL
jgi:hypothetical protein